MLTRAAIVAIVTLLGAVSCGRAPEPREFELNGQILGIEPDSRQVLIKHQDIVGFMPGMTMSFTVNDEALLTDKTPGDLVTATLVVEEVGAYLSTLTTTGHAPLDVPPAGPVITDADLLKEGDLVPDLPLIDQNDEPRPMSSLRGHRIALTFIYTRCPLPGFCPLMDRNFLTIQREIERMPTLEDVRLVTVTIDPLYDTPEVLREHARTLEADPQLWHFLTGSEAEIGEFAKAFGVVSERENPTAVETIHNLRTAVVDAEGRLVAVRSGNDWTPAQLIANLNATPASAN